MRETINPAEVIRYAGKCLEQADRADDESEANRLEAVAYGIASMLADLGACSYEDAMARIEAASRHTHDMSRLVGASDAAHIMGMSVQRVGALCRQGRLEGAQKIGGSWCIPITTAKAWASQEHSAGRPKAG